MTVALPTEKSKPGLRLSTAKVMIYGPPKIGKSTFASELLPDNTLFLACEPGLDGLEVFSEPIKKWADFRQAVEELAADPKQFRIVVVDTVDELYRMCSDHVCAEFGIKHPADLEYGKGWGAVGDEFRLRVGKLSNLGLGVWFVSHAKDVEVKKKVGTKTVTQSTLAGQGRQYITGFVDLIFLATWEGDEESSRRILRTQGGEEHEAGGRMPKEALPLTDPLPLEAKALAADFTRAMKPMMEAAEAAETKPAPKKGAKKGAKPEPVAA
jgi:hypothetical protein